MRLALLDDDGTIVARSTEFTKEEWDTATSLAIEHLIDGMD